MKLLNMKLAFIFIMLFISKITLAAVPAWQIVPQKSKLSFMATQNDSPVTGQFKSFTGEINFDPDQLSESHVRIIVDLNSVTASYGQVADTLKTLDWFDVKLFPHAVFTANSFTKTGNNAYQSNGTLTIRDKTLPLQLNFILDQNSPTEAKATGKTILKRTAFGVGRGDWSDTKQVKDEVEVDFNLTATKK
jgi:polyisoprenoid-binding protein YceI